MQNKKRGLSSDRDVSALYNNPLKRVSLDIPALVEFPLNFISAFAPDLCDLRIVRRLAIPAHLLIRGDVVDLSRGISLIFLAARGTGPALDKSLSLPDIFRIPPPFLHLRGVCINGVVEVRHSEPFLNFMIVHFFQPLLCDLDIFRLFLNADVVPT